MFRDTVFEATIICSVTLIMFPFCHKNTNLNFFIFIGYQIENILQLFTGLQFDICHVIKTRVGFKIAEMTRYLKTLENPQEYVHSEVISFIKLLNAKLLILNFSAEIFIFNFFF